MPRSRAAAAAPRLGPGRTDADIFGEARCECYRRCSFGSLWKQWGFLGHGQELREVIALVESGQLTSIPIEVQPLAGINEVYARLKRGEVRGRAVIQPAA
jgi:hypothetical protein